MGCAARSAELRWAMRSSAPKRVGLLLHVLDELGALDAFGPAGKVFDQGGDGELAAGLVALEDERLEVGARGVDGGGEAGAAGAEDDECRAFRVGVGEHEVMGLPSVNARGARKDSGERTRRVVKNRGMANLD